MSLDRLQCPSCGAPLAPDGRGAFLCSYCGTRLRLSQRPSGEPPARRDTGVEGADLMAMLAARSQLEAELEYLQAEEADLKEALAAAEEARLEADVDSAEEGRRKPIIGWLVLLGLGSLLAGPALMSRQPVAGVVALLAGAFMLAFDFLGRGTSGRHLESGPGMQAELARLQNEIREVSEELTGLRADIDGHLGDA